jgi:CDP-6-deoxy-D-xylo-4-hexulose-3-dehydrase
MSKSDELRTQILELVGRYWEETFNQTEFESGTSNIPVSGKVFDDSEMKCLVDSALDFWLTTGRYAEQFEERFAEFMGVRYSLLCNSGSSANLLALSSLTSPTLKDRQLKPGDEVITAAVGFPTTVNPVIQYGLTPVFVDVDIPTYNVLPEAIESAISSRTKAVFIAHTLGNPFDALRIRDICDQNNLWLIEDTCDAIGAKIDSRMVGSIGDLSTASFYPAHHITMGEGGAVLTSSPKLRKIVESMRDWGRDCWCPPGRDDTCGKRYDWNLGDLPSGYDHKYTYSHIGYNLKTSDMNAAVGVAQLDKLEAFISRRRELFTYFRMELERFSDQIILPEATVNSEPSWFGFPITIRPDGTSLRDEMVKFLNHRKIGSRFLFGGNILRQPAYANVHSRIVGSLSKADKITEDTFWTGVFPGISDAMAEYIVTSFEDFFNSPISVRKK